jgi:hypothetical protein
MTTASAGPRRSGRIRKSTQQADVTAQLDNELAREDPMAVATPSEEPEDAKPEQSDE